MPVVDGGGEDGASGTGLGIAARHWCNAPSSSNFAHVSIHGTKFGTGSAPMASWYRLRLLRM